MRKIAIALLLAGSMLAFAQDKPTPLEMSATEQMALVLIQQEYKTAQDALSKAQKDAAAFKTDFAKAHPGWRFDDQKGPVKDAPEEKK
jgi:hypothetical protein